MNLLTDTEKTYPPEDQAYIIARNSLIPEALKDADRELKLMSIDQIRGIVHGQIFLRRMDELARERNI